MGRRRRLLASTRSWMAVVGFAYAPLTKVVMAGLCLTSLLVSLAENMASYGITTTAVINAHYGNFDAMKAASRQLKEQGITLLSYSWAGLDEEVKRWQTTAVAYPGYMHADEVETSLMLALAPEFVTMTNARAHYPAFPNNFR